MMIKGDGMHTLQMNYPFSFYPQMRIFLSDDAEASMVPVGSHAILHTLSS
jgi:hypothetical protein